MPNYDVSFELIWQYYSTPMIQIDNFHRDWSVLERTCDEVYIDHIKVPTDDS